VTTPFIKAAAGRYLPRRYLSLLARVLVASFVNLSRPVDTVSDAFSDKIEAAFDRGFYLSNRGVGGVVDGIKQLSDLMGVE